MASVKWRPRVSWFLRGEEGWLRRSPFNHHFCAKIFTAQYVSTTTSPKLDLACRMATRVLTLPDGSWPETLQAERDLEDALPAGVSMEKMLEIAAQQSAHVHRDRKDWLRAKASAYTEAESKRLFPALR